MSDIEVLEIEVDYTDFMDKPESCIASSLSRRPSDFTRQFRTSISTRKKLTSSNPSITRPDFMQSAGFTTSATTGCMEAPRNCRRRNTPSSDKLSPKIWHRLATPLGDHVQHPHKMEVRTAQTLEVPEKKKRESGAQWRKQKRAEQIAKEGLRDTHCR